MTWTAPDALAARFHRRRRLKRGLGISALVAIAASALITHARPGLGQTDWSRFQRQNIQIIGVVDGQTLSFADGTRTRTLRLLGVAAPLGNDAGAAEAVAYLRATAVDRPANLLLDWPQTRDQQGRLLAFVYLADDDLLNVDVVRDGACYAERRTPCLLQEPITTAEKTARKAKRGFWSRVSWNQTPQWRRAWFATRPQP